MTSYPPIWDFYHIIMCLGLTAGIMGLYILVLIGNYK